MLTANLRRKLAVFPRRAGVYLFKNSAGKVLYVGKAGDLASRVRSHFGPSSHLGPKQALLVDEVSDFDYIVTNSELEALLLDARRQDLDRLVEDPPEVEQRDECAPDAVGDLLVHLVGVGAANVVGLEDRGIDGHTACL